MPEIDLDRLAAAYGHRSEEHAAARAGRAAEAAGLAPGSVAVDIGGGRGAHAAEFARHGAMAVVIDPAVRMLRAAPERVLAVRGRGEALPLGWAVADLAYFHMSIHHGDWRLMVDEALRVLRPDGVVWVWSLASQHHRRSFLARWFPSVVEIDEARFPDPGDVAAALAERGCSDVEEGREVAAVARTVGEWVTAVEAGFVSTLHLLDPAEIGEGLARFRAEHPDPEETVRYTLAYARVSAHRSDYP